MAPDGIVRSSHATLQRSVKLQVYTIDARPYITKGTKFRRARLYKVYEGKQAAVKKLATKGAPTSSAESIR